MMGHADPQRTLFYQLSLESFVPPEHPLRAIRPLIEDAAIRRACRALYSPIGRPSIPPEQVFLDEFPAVLPSPMDTHGAVDTWVVELPSHIENGDLVVPPGKYFMMGDHRHASMDSRFWGFVPRENIMGRPLFNYWSFQTPEDQQEKSGIGNSLAWMGHVAVHFFTDTRWKRTLKPVR